MTINGGDYEPVEVQDLDVVGFNGEEFVLLMACGVIPRKLPEFSPGIPAAVRCRIQNNQKINFSGEMATLHDIGGAWHFKNSTIEQIHRLQTHTFFEIGHNR